jgi:Fe-S-cluster containining protein
MKKAASNLEYFNDEEKALLMYPKEKFIEVIQNVGFECDLCGKCCTRVFNDHVYLLKEDVTRLLKMKNAANALVPSPYFDFCDQHGCFYVSGYSLKTQKDENGSCIFLQKSRCQIYEQRPLICRIYPYMIHRETDKNETFDWREISGLNEHGFYETEIKTERAKDIFDETFTYEKGYIEQEKEFLKAITAYFEKNKLKHIPKIHAERLRDYEKGKEVTVLVYYNGAF